MEVQRSADLTAMGRTYPQISDEPGVISARVRPVLKKRGLAALSVEDREEPVPRAGAEALTLLLDRRAVDDLTATSEGQGAAAPAAHAHCCFARRLSHKPLARSLSAF